MATKKHYLTRIYGKRFDPGDPADRSFLEGAPQLLRAIEMAGLPAREIREFVRRHGRDPRPREKYDLADFWPDF